MKKYRFYKWLIKKFPFSSLQDKLLENPLRRLLVYVSFIFIVFTFYISLFLLFFVYLGTFIYKKGYLEKLGNKIRKQFHRVFWKKTHFLIGILEIFILIFILVLVLAMAFTIPIFLLILLGYRLEKKKFDKNNNKSNTFVIKYRDFNDINKKETKTIESI